MADAKKLLPLPKSTRSHAAFVARHALVAARVARTGTQNPTALRVSSWRLLSVIADIPILAASTGTPSSLKGGVHA